MLLNKNENWGIVFFLNKRLYDYAGFISTLYSLVDYANLYGNIYANTPKVDKGYARIGIDNVLFRTTFSNIYDHQFNAHLIYSNSDGIILDSVLLYDDGIHGDSLSNDGIYGGYIPPQQTNDFYSLGVSTIDNQTNKYFNTPDICKFTTIPLLIDSLPIGTANNYRYTFKPFLKNAGTSLTIENIIIKLTSNDPWVTLIFPEGGRGCPNLLPGDIKGVVQPFVVTYDSATFPGPGYFNLTFNISSNGWDYWQIDTTISITGISDAEPLPIYYTLDQNFPNPFNPVTTIKYQIPHRSNVSLKIYDIIGNEVADLINEEQEVGFYNIDFDASKFSSGVYFYRIQAGSFVQTRKMILLK
ncbi:MAG: T9SS type A sorting domain-containing protein [Ignavibacteriales bacterium]|nr:T9SS type A sorting domain-containing protein [Ignavibacteriales bacterium]